MPHALSYLSIGLFRILLGLFVAGELVFRFLGNFPVFFSPKDGILGRCFSEQYLAHYGFPFNPLFYATNDFQVIAYLVIALVLSVALIAGWYGRFAALGLMVLLGLWFHRFPSLYVGFEQYGICMLGLAVLLPVDRALGVMSGPEANRADAVYTSPLCSFALIQIGAIYFFNAIFKYGDKWLNGTAVAFASVDPDRATFLAPIVASSSILSALFTYSTLLAEFLLIFLLLVRSKKAWPRYAAAASIILLHWGIALVIDVGNFKWISLSAVGLILPVSFWAGKASGLLKLLSAKTLPRKSQPLPQPLPESLPAPWLLTAFLIYALVSSQLDQWLSSPIQDPVRDRAAQSSLGRAAMAIPRPEVRFSPLNQYWHMFAPNPPQERGYLEVQFSNQQGETMAQFNGNSRESGHYAGKLEQQFCNVLLVRRGRNEYDKIAQRCFLEREISMSKLPGIVQADLAIMSFRPETFEELNAEPVLKRYILEGRKIR